MPRANPGLPAPKRGERLKTGCYTCRLRRKKCDLASSPPTEKSQQCNNCERLCIQCLGFGLKRPDWLKAKQSDIVRKIKAHCGNAKNKSSPTTFLRLLDDSDDDTYSSSPPASSSSLELYDSRGSSCDAPADEYTSSFPPSTCDLSRQDDDLDAEYASYSDYPIRDRADVPLELDLQPLGTETLTPFDDLVIQTEDDLALVMAPAVNVEQRSSVQSSWFFDSSWISPYAGLTSSTFHHPDLAEQYATQVARKQWLLVDPATMHGLLQVITNNASNDIPRQAAMLLARVHNNLTHNVEDSESTAKYNDIKRKSSVVPIKYADQAWCAFMLISVILFLGGRGEWNGWIDHACHFVLASFDDSTVHERERLRSLGQAEQFLVKASIWFDVIAAISTGQPARLQTISRRLFTPPAISVAGPAFHTSKEFSMLEVMGCESHVVLALSNALDLAAWKDQQLMNGTLSYRELVEFSASIEKGIHKEAKPLTGTDELSVKRHFCSEMYRTSTLLFLRSIVSGDFPGVKDIQDGIADVMAVWRQAQNRESLYTQSITSAIVRMALFAFAICGALTNRKAVRAEIEAVLEAQGVLGNSASLLKLLRELWSTRRAHDAPVRWREALKQQNLLLV